MPDNPRIEELRRRVQLDPASIAFAALAEEYRRTGRFEEAIATCEAGLQRHPAYLSARVTLGRSLLEMGRFADAKSELEQVLRIAPENLAAIRALAEIHTKHREYGGADEALETVEPAKPEPAVEPSPAPAPIPVTLSMPSEPPIAVPTPTPAAAPAIPDRPKDHPEADAARALEEFLAGLQRVRSTIP